MRTRPFSLLYIYLIYSVFECAVYWFLFFFKNKLLNYQLITFVAMKMYKLMYETGHFDIYIYIYMVNCTFMLLVNSLSVFVASSLINKKVWL